jgi:hypothetical protein
VHEGGSGGAGPLFRLGLLSGCGAPSQSGRPVSTPQTGQRLPGGVSRRAPHVARMLAWVGVDGLRLEAARVVLGEYGLRATGSLVSCQQDGIEAYSASYSLSTDETGVVQRLTVRLTRAQGEQHVTLTRSEEGNWLVDHGQGAARTDFGGALDVDLEFSPLFNALPVRRLALHRIAAKHGLAMVFVSLPSLEVSRVPQTYRTVSVGEPAVICLGSDSYDVEFTVDADGLVLDYPGLAHRA